MLTEFHHKFHVDYSRESWQMKPKIGQCPGISEANILGRLMGCSTDAFCGCLQFLQVNYCGDKPITKEIAKNL